MKRIFAAFRIPDELINQFIEISEVNYEISGICWTKDYNFHITLFFIGEVEEENIEKIIRKLENISSHVKPFDLNFEKVEIKSKNKKPSLIWARFEKCIEFSDLSNAIYNEVSEFMTISITHKDPVPHCTLARIKSGTEIEMLDLENNISAQLNVDRIELWMTVQTEAGVRYDSLAGFDLVD